MVSSLKIGRATTTCRQYLINFIVWVILSVVPGSFSFQVLRFQSSWPSYQVETLHAGTRSITTVAGHDSDVLVDVQNTPDILRAVFRDDQHDVVKYLLEGAARGAIGNLPKENVKLATMILEKIEILSLPVAEKENLEAPRIATKLESDSLISRHHNPLNLGQVLDIFVEIRFDGGSRGNPGLGGCGVELLYGWQLNGKTSGSRRRLVRHFLGDDKITNNQAEYQGLIRGLEEAKQVVQSCQDECDISVRNSRLNLLVQGDSKLIVDQLSGTNRCKSKNLIPLFSLAKSLLLDLESSALAHNVTLEHIRREFNGVADALANEAMDQRQTSVEESNEDDSAILSMPPEVGLEFEMRSSGNDSLYDSMSNERPISVSDKGAAAKPPSKQKTDVSKMTTEVEAIDESVSDWILPGDHSILYPIENSLLDFGLKPDAESMVSQADKKPQISSDVSLASTEKTKLNIFAAMRYFGASNRGFGGAGVAMNYTWTAGEQSGASRQVLIKNFLGKKVTKNRAEYQALILGLQEGADLIQECQRSLGVDHENTYLHFCIDGDSKFVAKQFRGDLQCKSEVLKPLHSSACNLLKSLEGHTCGSKFTIDYVSRKDNAVANALANQAIAEKESSVVSIGESDEDITSRGLDSIAQGGESSKYTDRKEDRGPLQNSRDSLASPNPNETTDAVVGEVALSSSESQNVEAVSHTQTDSPSETAEVSKSSNSDDLRMSVDLTFGGGSRGSHGLGGAGSELNVRWSKAGDTVQGQKVEVGTFLGEGVTSNEADYHSLIRGLEEVVQIVKSCQADCSVSKGGCQLHLSIHGKSKLIVQQLNGKYQCKSERLVPLFSSAQSLLRCLEDYNSGFSLTIDHVKRVDNGAAAFLATEAMDRKECWVANSDIFKIDAPLIFPIGELSVG